MGDLIPHSLVASSAGGASAEFWLVMAGLCFLTAPLNYVLWKRSLGSGVSARQQFRYRRAWQLLPLLGILFLARVLLP